MSATTELLLIVSAFNLILGFWCGLKLAAWVVRKHWEQDEGEEP